MAPPLRGLTLAAAALLLGGCRGGDASFAPIALVADRDGAAPERFVAPDATVTIAEVARPSLDAVTPLRPQAEQVDGPAGQRLRVRLPLELGAVPWIVLESVVTTGGVSTMMRSWPVTGALAGSTYEAVVVQARVGPHDETGVVLWPVPDLAKRDVTTREVLVPERAVLQVAVGLEPASWSSTAIPIEMTIAGLAAGRETALRTVRLDPRRPEARRWIDVAVPLDALAGRAMRFRFAARPIVGPTAVPSLPAWSVPRIVDARALDR